MVYFILPILLGVVVNHKNTEGILSIAFSMTSISFRKIVTTLPHPLIFSNTTTKPCHLCSDKTCLFRTVDRARSIMNYIIINIFLSETLG